jgi:hypothetical protein
VPLHGVLGAAIAVAVATVFWLATCSIMLARLTGLRTDVIYLLGRMAEANKANA